MCACAAVKISRVCLNFTLVQKIIIMDSSLKKEIEAILGYVGSLPRHETQASVVENLKARISSFDGDRDQLDKLCEELSAIWDQRGTYKKLFEELKACQEDERLLSAQYKDCTEELDYGMTMQKSLFEKAFGLRTKLTADKAVSFEFQHLRSDAVCCITLDVNTEGRWEVVQMEPLVPGVQVILDQLNETNDLTTFCKDLRHKFKECVLVT